MTTFLLVHGAFHGGWCYDRVRPLLEAKGHRVLTPTLSGLGERSHLAPLGGINLDTHIQDIVNLITWHNLQDVVLCGHSYSGMVITAVADTLPDRIAALAYLDGIVPEDGDSAISGLPMLLELFVPRSAEHGGLLVTPLPAAAIGLSDEDAAWVDPRLTPHPLACFTQQISLTGAYRAVKKRVLIYVPSGPFVEKYENQRDISGNHVFILDSGHDFMIENPKELAEILINTC